ncbi:uncharacterized protein LOC106054502 [Biomphalaria glabrata]|uniref:Uncharacterized protein LOC106054502 n=1 Tax=Biomphalaria glabrata TaxID=6526 RepID=A0A9W2ZUL8_BIOGL|nr:uncharacterized protein LOC106054502 [Biomphalaria glabrata]
MGNEGTKIQNETMDETEKFLKLTPSDIIGDMDGLAVHELDLPEPGDSLQLHLKACKKNPGHPNFIPVNSFSLEHLPEGYRDEVLYEVIKSIASLTVKLSVNVASPQRPTTWPGTSIPYPFSGTRYKNVLRTGTGKVYQIIRVEEGDTHGWGKNTKCVCGRCRMSQTPSNVWWEIDIITATHVIFDSVEAENTTCDFFFDSQESPGYRLDNMIMKSYGIATDKSSMKCITCNEELADKLGAALNKWEQLRWTAFYRHKKDAQKMAVVVSHPHGCSKQISLGQWLEKVKGEGGNVFKHTYTACTCPGSSGAPVYFAGFTFNSNVSYGFQFNERAHSGAFGKEINFSF